MFIFCSYFLMLCLRRLLWLLICAGGLGVINDTEHDTEHRDMYERLPKTCENTKIRVSEMYKTQDIDIKRNKNTALSNRMNNPAGCSLVMRIFFITLWLLPTL